MAEDLNQQNNEGTPETEPVPAMETMPEAPEEKHSLLFPILGGLLVLLVLVLGGLYLWGALLTETPSGDAMMEGDEMMEEEASGVEQAADVLDSIEQELESEDFSAMEAELDAIEQEIEAELQVN